MLYEVITLAAPNSAHAADSPAAGKRPPSRQIDHHRTPHHCVEAEVDGQQGGQAGADHRGVPVDAPGPGDQGGGLAFHRRQRQGESYNFV